MPNLVVQKGTTDLFKAYLISSLISTNSFYFIYGGTDPWPNSDTPPVVTGEERTLDLIAPLVWSRATLASPAVESTCSYINNGTQITIDESVWTLIQVDNLVSGQLATNLYISNIVNRPDLGVSTIRYMAIVIGTTFNTGVNVNKTLFQPSEIDFPGYLIYLANFSPITLADCGVDSTKFGVIINV